MASVLEHINIKYPDQENIWIQHQHQNTSSCVKTPSGYSSASKDKLRINYSQIYLFKKHSKSIKNNQPTKQTNKQKHNQTNKTLSQWVLPNSIKQILDKFHGNWSSLKLSRLESTQELHIKCNNSALCNQGKEAIFKGNYSFKKGCDLKSMKGHYCRIRR